MITSNSNPKVKQVVQWQTRAKEREAAGIFLVEGFKMYEEAPEEKVREVYISAEALDRISGEAPDKVLNKISGKISDKISDKASDKVPDRTSKKSAIWEKLDRTGYEIVSAEVLRKMSDTQTPQGILCVIERPVYSLERLLAMPRPLLVVLEDLQDPGNLGTIVRTGEGAGITGVIMSERTVDIYNPKTIRATMGSIFRVPYVCVQDLCKTVEMLSRNGVHTYAAHLEGEKYYDSFSFREGSAFLIGNESKGLSRELADCAESYLKIPMEGRVESLNAAVTASLLMYEAHRQRFCSRG